jgi:flavin-dependent dehydrogenase
VEARFLVKRGARFVDGARSERNVRYAFAEAFHAKDDHAFEVPRDEFDELLFRRAGACGAELREGWRATGMETHGGWTTVRAFAPGEEPRQIRARFVVDATGREALLAREAHDVHRIPQLDRTAIFTQVRGAWRDEGERAGDIQIVVFGEAERRGWFWLIPFADGRTSVGAVVSGAWVRANRPDAAGPEALFEAAAREAPSTARMLEHSERLFVPRATADFSFRVDRLAGDGWVAIGDAGGFIDPLFSTGAHLAMHGGLRAGEAIDQALAGGDVSSRAFAAWEREMRTGASLFLGAVQAFYGADLVDYLFAEPQHPFLRRAITSLLSGAVFDEDARWAKEMRSRFPPRG